MIKNCIEKVGLFYSSLLFRKTDTFVVISLM